MYFLLSGCQNPDILRIIYLAKMILNIATTIIPIGMIVVITIDVFKIVLGADTDKTISSIQKLIFKRVMYSILVFFAPTIVSITTNLVSTAGLTEVGTNYKQCIANATKETIKDAQIAQDIEEELKDKERKQKIYEEQKEQKAYNDSSSSSSNTGNNENNNSDNNTEITPGSEASGNTYQQLAAQMIQVATKEVGYQAAKDKNKYAKEIAPSLDGEPWCAIFVTWVSKKANAQNTNLFNDVIQKEKPISNFASAVGSIYNFHTNSNLQFYYSKHYGGNYTPKKGDYIYFNWGNNWNKNIYNGMFIANSHIGIVEYTSNGVVHTIEGNSGNDTVIKGSYQLTNPSIMGYGSWYK